MEEKPKIIVVGGGKLPLWKIIVAAALYTLIIFFFFLWLKSLIIYRSFFLSSEYLIDAIHCIGLFLPPALTLSVIITKYIDIPNDTLIKEYRIGLFRKTTHRDIPQLEYVSIFEKDKYSDFEVNIWYLHKGYRRFNVGTFGKKSEAIEYGKSVAQTLKIDLLDATEKGNSKWIDLE